MATTASTRERTIFTFDPDEWVSDLLASFERGVRQEMAAFVERAGMECASQAMLEQGAARMRQTLLSAVGYQGHIFRTYLNQAVFHIPCDAIVALRRDQMPQTEVDGPPVTTFFSSHYAAAAAAEVSTDASCASEDVSLATGDQVDAIDARMARVAATNHKLLSQIHANDAYIEMLRRTRKQVQKLVDAVAESHTATITRDLVARFEQNAKLLDDLERTVNQASVQTAAAAKKGGQ